MTKKAIVIIDCFGFYDAMRTTLFEEFSKTVDFLCVINTNVYKNLNEESAKKIVEKILVDSEIVFVLSVNNAGKNCADYLRQKGIAQIVWYLDSPLMISPRLQAPIADKIYHACDEFAAHPALNAISEFLPFSGAAPYPPAAEAPTKGIVFLGACWSSTRLLQKASVGLKCVADGVLYDVKEITRRINDDQFLYDAWLYIDGTPVNNHEIVSAYAAIKRCHHLENLLDFDLQIFGGYDWMINTASVAPNLALKFFPRSVNSHRQMNQLMKDFKVSLNIFHIQNRNGGPNFRVLDSAIHSVPMLSDYNTRCAEIFPHGEAALYYHNPGEAREFAQLLLDDRQLAAKLVKNAKDILTAEHLHRHRVEKMWSAIGKVAKFSESSAILELNETGEMEPIVHQEQQFKGDFYLDGEDMTKTNLYQYEKYWAQYPTFAQHDIKALQDKVRKFESKSLFQLAKKIAKKIF